MKFLSKKWIPSDMRLADQEVALDQADWFARTRLNVIDWYPQSTLNGVCLLLLYFTTAQVFDNALWAVACLFGFVPTLGVKILYRYHLRFKAPDHVQLLRTRAMLAVLNSTIWAGLLGYALSFAHGWTMAAVLALAMYRMIMFAMICLSIPFVGTLSMFILTVGIGTGLTVNGGAMGLIVAIIVGLCAHSLYSVIFNLYYMFATRRLRTRTLREANETVNLLLNDFDENSSGWLWETDALGHFVAPSRRFCEVTGLSREELATMRIGHIAEHGGELRRIYSMIRNKEAFREHQLPMNIKDGVHWWTVSGKPLFNAEGDITGYRGFASDITDTRQAEEKIAYLAHYDVLTGLGNRAMFAAELERMIARLRPEKSLAVLYVDLDHFKSINDGYGHGVGDQVLATAAQRLKSHLGPNDIAVRLGGDEFAVILSSALNKQSMLNVAQNIVDTISMPMHIERLHLHVGVSVGVAFYPDDAATPSQLLRCADLALYHAKEQGRGCSSAYDRDMHELMQERRQLTSDLRLAVSKGELELYYQPLIEIQTGETQGYEALLRWHHPTRGMVSPDDFIPIAEETGLIVSIGEWAIRTGLEELARWPKHLSLAVNLSPVQIRNENLINVIVQALGANNVDPTRFELEITESVLLHESEENVATLHQLRALGIRIALDDFGTGYSSLNYLRSFPFDKIKIDRSFVDQLNHRPENQAIVDAVVGLANNLQMATTAEGVENENQLEELRRNGCLQAQGFFFERPRPADALGLARTAKIATPTVLIAPAIVPSAMPWDDDKAATG